MIVGIVSFGRTIDFPAEQQISRVASRGNGHIRALRAESAFAVQSQAGSGPPPRHDPSPQTQGRLLFAAQARLDNRAELAAMLAVSAPELAETSDTTLILNSYRRWGEQGVARCLGAFAFAAWDAGDRRLTLGRDCLGDRAMFFHHGDGFVAFASDLGALLALPFVPREIDERMAANFLALNLTNPRRTFYRDVERVPSRTLVTITPQGTRHRHYWTPDFNAPPPYQREEDYVERARELLDQAVATATADTPRVAISTSGGLDSSAIAATAARLGRAESIRCFSVVPPEGMQLNISPQRYLDEREKVTALARTHPALDVEFCVEGSLHAFEEDPARFFIRTSHPILNPGLLGPFNAVAERAAATRHPVLLNGNTGNFGLTWSGQFSFFALLRNGRFPALARHVAEVARTDGRGLFRTFASEMMRFGVPSVLRGQLDRLRGRGLGDVARYSVLNPAMVAEMDLGRLWQEDGFDPWFTQNPWNPARLRARYMFDYNQIARDFRAMSRAINGVETRDPHSDRRLLEFTLAVPEQMYRRDGIRRSFARAVLADRLPSEILNEHRRGYQGATWFRRLDARRHKFAGEIDRLEASPLASRLIDVPRLKRMLQDWPRDENVAEGRLGELRPAFTRGLHVGRFILWVEGANA